VNAIFHMLFASLLRRVFRRPALWIEAHDRPLQPKYQPTFKQRHL
jgi:hypothetical protein